MTIHEIRIREVTDQFTFFAEVAVPTPMTEEVTTCVALIGRPVVFAKVTTKKVAICDAKEFFMFILQIFIPTVFIILYPPVIVPTAKAAPDAKTNQVGIDTKLLF